MSATAEERNFQKITFTNAPKIKKKPYKKRSVRQVCEDFYDHFKDEKTVLYDVARRWLIQEKTRCSRQTILAYLGRPKTRQVDKVDDHVLLDGGGSKLIPHEYIRNLPKKTGYLELYGLASLMTDRVKGKTWFLLHHTKQTEIPIFSSPLTNPQNESCALKESDAEFKDALAYAKRQNTSNKNILSCNSPNEIDTKKTVSQSNSNGGRDGEERDVYVREKI